MDDQLPRSTHAAHSYPPPLMSFKLDEGFSEAFPSQDEGENTTSAATAVDFQEWVMAQNEEHRAEIAYEVLRTLRTSSIAAVVQRLTPLLYIDPVQKLPAEITAEVFAYLDASTLLTASLSSRTWRERILDSRLWKKLYDGQGWNSELDEVRTFDNLSASASFRQKGKARTQWEDLPGGSNGSQPQLKKRATSGWFDHRTRKISADTSRWREQHSHIEADTDETEHGWDQEMRDAPTEPPFTSPTRPNKRHSQDSGDEMEIYSPQRHDRAGNRSTSPLVELEPPLKPALLLQEKMGDHRLNWSFLYKQRRRLEENWNKGRYTNFQLPHPQYGHEAHTECVYTIQFFGKWLVSGSRDKTLRIWDLETKRLRGKPLTGHTQSVLCLQFDPTEEEDVIISGSSDTSVIVWRFSTGQKLHEIPQAHSESVLNLRFDNKYLVTCSKDKLIKVWNRHAMLPTDPGYPRRSNKSNTRMPAYIIDINQYTIAQLTEKIDFQQIKPLRPYSNLMVLGGHSAAVNAIQIDGDKIVSASGDRNIKMWNVRDGHCIRTFQGHQKGIACVQYDTKRIVSGSSDNTVRIYDPRSGAELATLQGHSNLVRTVQAGFGDLPGSERDYEHRARAMEREYVEAVRRGDITDEPGRRPDGTTGTSKMTFGAALPPGGGGSQWGRIVSGSYDESIIVWKKDANGDWVIAHRLQQEAAVRAVNERYGRAPTRPIVGPTIAQTAATGAANMPIPSATQVVQQAMQQATTTAMAGLATGVQNVMSTSNLLGAPLAAWNASVASGQMHGNPAGNAAQHAPGWLPPGAQQAMHQLHAHAQNVMQAQIQAQQTAHQAVTQTPPQLVAHQVATQIHQQANQAVAQAANGPAHTNNPPVTTTTTTTTTNPNNNQPHPPHNNSNTVHNPNLNQTLHQNPNQPAQPNQHPQSVSRVFKLQFDARRIVCCSQDSRIVGWDFANGDSEIEEASKFFVGP